MDGESAKVTASTHRNAGNNSPANLPVIHAVTDGAAVCRAGFLTLAESAMRELKGRLAVHLRAPMISGRMFFELADALAQLQRETGAWLIVNDRADVAAAVAARGIQLNSKSLDVRDAQTVAPGIPVGASVHSVAEAKAAGEAGAAWCVAGNVFPTPTHPGRAGKRATFVADMAAAVTIPIIAIGGVKPEHVADLLTAGAYGVATIRGSGWSGEALLSRYIWEYDAYRARAQRNPAPDQREPTRSPL